MTHSSSLSHSRPSDYRNPEPDSFPTATNKIVNLSSPFALRGVQLGPSRRLNKPQSLTGVLPPEMLSEIFGHVCNNPDDIYDIYPLFQISSVCFYWRQTARSTPYLWTKLRLHFRYAKCEQANLLQLWLTNVRGAMLTLILSNCGSCALKTRGALAHILSVKENAEKIRDLAVEAPHSSWIPLITENCVNIEKLDITHMPDCKISLENQPHLRAFTLSRLQQSQSVKLFPSQKITTLKLKDASNPSICLGIVAQCQHSLVNLRIKAFGFIADYEEGREMEMLDPRYTNMPITLDHLRTLHLEFSLALEIYISYMKLPVLGNITLDFDLDEGGTYIPMERIPPLFQSLPCVPINLKISMYSSYESSEWIPFLERVLPYADRAQELNVILNPRRSSRLLELLCEVKVLPNLHRLIFHARSFEQPDTWFESFLEMIEIRKFGLEGRPFHLEVQLYIVNDSREWKEKLVRLVAGLVGKGYSISLSFNNVKC